MTRAPRRFWRQAVDIYLFQGLAIGVSLVGSVIVARTLGPSGKGTLDLFGLLSTLIIEFGLVGIGAGFIFELANRRQPMSEIHGDAVAVALAAGGLGLALAVTASDAVAGLVGSLPAKFAAVALMMTAFLAYSGLWPSLMVGSDRTPSIYRVQFFLATVTTAVVLALWGAQALSVETFLATSVCVAVLGSAVQFTFTRRLHQGTPLQADRSSLSRSFGYGLRVYPAMIANWMHFRVDQIVISHVIGPAGVGFYALGVRWAEMLWLVGYGVLNAGLFRIASSGQGDAYRFSVRLFFLVLVLSGSAGIVLALVAGPLIGLLYGPAFEPSVLPLILLIPGVVAWDAARVLSNYVSFNRGRPIQPTAVAVAGAGLNLGLTLFLVPRWGINGAAAASSVSYGVVLLASVVIFRRSV